MKYIKSFEHKLQDIKDEYKYSNMLGYICDKLKIICIELNHTKSLQNHLNKNNEVLINMNLNSVKGSILSILCENLLHGLRNNIEVYYDNKGDLVETLNIKAKFNIKVEDMYITVMNNILNSANKTDGTIWLAGSGLRTTLTSSIIDLLKTFIKDNVYFEIEETNISDEFLYLLFDYINYQDNRHSIITSIRLNQVNIYNKLKSIFGDQIDTSSELGEMGFSD